jgi:farnesyl diphosphate synthase
MSDANLTALHCRVRAAVDQYLQHAVEALPDHAPKLKDAMGYALLVGGKRMRPLLSAITAQTLNVQEQDYLPVAAAIECIHAYSLVHDDLPAMDDDDLRRGQPTCHIKFDEATAILAGDALQTLAFELLTQCELSAYADSQRVKLLSCIAKAGGYRGMCGGQAIDLASTDNDIDIHQLKLLHRLKTGALLTACVESITLLADGLAPQSAQALIDYAQKMGLAFQIQDDILDVTETSETLGKPAGSDEKSNKSTFPALLGLANAKQELQEYHSQALQAIEGLPYNTALLRQFADLMFNRTY